MASHFVYIILCEDGSLYTGTTKNLNARLKLHVNGRGARYTRIHRPRKLVHIEEFGSRAEAMRRERRVKRLKHAQKLKLINSTKNTKIRLRKSVKI